MSSIQINYTIYASVMLLAGIGIPIMAAINANLSQRIHSLSYAVLILLFTSTVFTLIYKFLFDKNTTIFYQETTPKYIYMAGLFFVFYIFSISWIVPKFGIGNAVAFVILGQLIAMTVIDHFGLMSAIQVSLSSQRAIGLTLMAIGVFMVVARK